MAVQLEKEKLIIYIIQHYFVTVVHTFQASEAKKIVVCVVVVIFCLLWYKILVPL